MTNSFNALHQEIATLIAHNGPISVEHYMTLCLSHPTLGYYKVREPFGERGDFITAPEISQMFGELLGLWAAEAWGLCQAFLPARLMELGPGRGFLMADALRAARLATDFYDHLDVTLVETSPRLITRQKETLSAADRPLHWIHNVEEAAPAPAIILANEFFDALPIRQYVQSPEGWRQREIGLNAEGAFIFGLSPALEPQIAKQAPNGTIYEVGTYAQRLAFTLGAHIVRFGGAILLIDYGYTTPLLGDSLQATRSHHYVDPLTQPGEADLTAHVDFSALAHAFQATGARVFGPVTQSAFLQSLGITTRACALKTRATPQQAQAIDAALERLTATARATDMGGLFKVMAVARRDCPLLPGFIEQAMV